MGLHDKAAPATNAPQPTSRLQSKSRATTEAERGYYDAAANVKNIHQGINVNDYKDYTPFDSGSVFVSPYMDDTRAMNQGAGEQLWNGAVRLVGSTATKVMSGVGYLGGFANLAGHGFDDISRMTDNGWSAYFDGLEQNLKNANPIYKPSWVQNGGFWDKASSLSFYMDEGVDGLAYMVSSMIPGAAVAKGLQLGTRIARIIGSGAKTAGIIDNSVITALSTISEAATEAHGVQQRVRQELAPKVKNGEMTQEQAEVKAAEAARNDFLVNGLILLGPNALQTKFFFGDAAKTAERSVLKKIVDESGKVITDVGPVTKNLIAKNMLKKAGLGIAVEGLWEENAQLAAENLFVNKATDPETDDSFFGNMAENFTTTEGQMSMFLGGFMGVIGGGVGGFIKGRAEKNAIKSAQTRLNSINATYTADLKNTVKDLYEKETVDGKEEYKKDAKGNLIVNKEKATEVFEKLRTNRNLETLKQAALLSGKKDLFETFQNISFANLAIEHLMYGEGSLEVLNNRIDSLAEENKKEYEEMFSMLGEPTTLSIEKAKEDQKNIAKVIYNTLEREKNFSGVWKTPTFKSKDELKQYDSFVQNMIGNKALADARIAFADQKISETKKETAIIKTTLNNLQESLSIQNKNLDSLSEMEKTLSNKAVTEEQKELKKSLKERGITLADIRKEIEDAKTAIDEVKENIEATNEELANNDKKSKQLVNDRDVLKKEFGNLTNTSLRDKIQEEWSKRVVINEKKAEETEKVVSKKKEEEEKEVNGTSEGSGANIRASNALSKELQEKIDTYNKLVNLVGDEDPEMQELAQQIVELRAKEEGERNNTSITPPVVDDKKSETTPDVDVSQDYNSTVSKAMTATDELNPEKSAAKNPKVNLKLGNTLPSVTGLAAPQGPTYSNVVMHKQLEHTSVLGDKIRFFYFQNDDKGNPIPANVSGVDFKYVNSPESLQPGSEVEFKLVELTKDQLDSITRDFNIQKSRIEAGNKAGAKVSSDDNYGYGDLSKAIGIYSDNKLIGFTQLPKMFDWTSESAKAQEITRNEIIAERKAILERLEKGEKVTSTISTKGKGNYYSRSTKGNNIEIKNQDDTNITPEVRTIDKVEDQSVFGYYKSSEKGGEWIIPDFSTKADTKKTLQIMRNNLSGIGGFNGQVAMMVKTANGSWSPIPVFCNTLSEALQDELWNRLVNGMEADHKTVIASINDIAYASIDDSSPFRIYPNGSDTFISIGAAGPWNLKDLTKHEKELKEEIANLRVNLVGTKINNKSYQDMLTANQGIVTNVVTVNGDYFLQPFMTFDSILNEEQKEQAETKALPENKPANETTLEVSTEELEALGITGTGYVSTLDAAPINNEVIVSGRAYTVDDQGIVKDSKGTIIRTESTRNAVLKEEAIKNNFFVDVPGHRVLAILTTKNGVSKRDIKIVSLQSNKEVSNKQQKADIAQANPAIGEFIKKFC